MHRMPRELTDEQYDDLEEQVVEGERVLTFDELCRSIDYLQRRGVERWPGEPKQGFLDTVGNLARNTVGR